MFTVMVVRQQKEKQEPQTNMCTQLSDWSGLGHEAVRPVATETGRRASCAGLGPETAICVSGSPRSVTVIGIVTIATATPPEVRARGPGRFHPDGASGRKGTTRPATGRHR